MKFSAYLKFAKTLAKEVGEIHRSHWRKKLHIEEKKFIGDLVTEADKESEQLIVNRIRASYPDHAILAEESGLSARSASDYLWAIDPVDGTTNYAHSFPFVAVSIALLYQGEPVVGVVYNAILKQLFAAAKGQGATLNGKKIEVSANETLRQSLLATGFAYDRTVQKDTNYPEFGHLSQLCQGVRRAGSAALDMAYVALGSFDGYWERGVHVWDIAAGTLLVREAGGVVTNYDLSPVSFLGEHHRILATNGKLHSVMSEELLKLRRP